MRMNRKNGILFAIGQIDHLASLDVKIAWDPGRHGPGNNLFFIINDTDGNWVELSAELEQLTYDRHVSIWPYGEKR